MNKIQKILFLLISFGLFGCQSKTTVQTMPLNTSERINFENACIGKIMSTTYNTSKVLSDLDKILVFRAKDDTLNNVKYTYHY